MERLLDRVSRQPRANPAPVGADTSSLIWSRGQGYLARVIPVNTVEMRFLTSFGFSSQDDLDSHFLVLKMSSNLADDNIFPGSMRA